MTMIDVHILLLFIINIMFFYVKSIILGQKSQFIVIFIVSLTNEKLLQLKQSFSIYDGF